MEPKGKNSIFSNVLIEILTVVLIVIAILATLNYFAVIPLSDTFPFLSFLPKRNSVIFNKNGNSQLKGRQIKAVITPVDFKEFSNKSKKYDYLLVPNSDIKVNGEITFDFEINIKDAGEGNSGLILTNGLSNDKKSFKYIHFFYYKEGNNWSMEYKDGEESTFFYIGPVMGNSLFSRFSVNLSPDGKTVRVVMSGTPEKTFNLKTSLYEPKKDLNLNVEIAPGAEVTLYSLYYQY